jgi:ring-1,2-phenylacetyl-CoA epoxidase subunit PaaD
MVAWDVLRTVMDPEVPALSVVDLGIVRDIETDPDGGVTVSITPTYSGCPAMDVIKDDITAALHERGFADVRIRTVYSPAWTTDWIDDAARQKLVDYGIAPPALVPLQRRVACPHCGSRDTSMKSEFGATACKSLMYCNGCQQPFELFKAL